MLRKIILIAILFASVALHANDATFSKPKLFAFGSSLDSIKTKLEPFCNTLKVRKIEPMTAPLATISQDQIDCSGFVYGGKERNIELVFQDNQLDIVWILFPKKDKPTFVAEFENLYGTPTMDIEFGTVFLQANAAIRNNPSEVLFASSRHVAVMLEQLKQQ